MDIKHVTVAGAGVLGSQIAFQIAYRGFDVTVWLRSEESVDRARPRLERLRRTYLETLEAMKTDTNAYSRGLVDSPHVTASQLDQLKERVERAAGSIRLTTSYEEAGRQADLLIEAISENPDDKIAFYEKMANHLPENAIIATNSSTMVPSRFAKFTGRPERYLAMHFANQIWRRNTAEIMGHPGTSKEVFDEIVEFAKAIAMIPLVLHKEQPGYILNTLLIPFLAAAEQLIVDEVADIETIDKTWMLATGAPVGPIRSMDIIGLRTMFEIGNLDKRAKDPGSVQGRIQRMLKQHIDRGETGVESGKGFYSYQKRV
ncbi:3-hydroxyacyl-CoA dehydrogenase NAD-binding protein [Coriobacterium glomerans PW2]|uniref:3-hydroxyacyl-CoA dehydrogenase NAD-binding protein n=1 Tax=Coriobacterium glomerans (strain ATCC 49209 / DSM 20642 / JCM 10262 / PW2) TaxID=700015 RepID=F2NBH1_CORGP|nr:3-hydroxyacyl-CoA dehydrogenase [Coriobacterium glomerans]AEB06707.1 3-hydroxyacyl-CoA dehydrogenase NAD-binding protein [Coriobacterium glomerans PW2]